MMPTMSFKSSYAAGVVLTILFFICFAAAIFLVKRNILCEWKAVLFDWSSCMGTDAAYR